MKLILPLALALFLAPAAAEAVPAFARQTGMACSACHTQQFPTLNAFGRSFKMGGYTLMGTQPLVEGTRMSIPATLNASLYFKIRMQKTNGGDAPGAHTTNSGELQFPDEFALLLAGRVGNYIGFLLEGQLPGNDAALLAGFKIPFSYNLNGIQASVIPFTTDALGVSYGFELMNTGAVRNIRFIEHRSDISAQQYIGTATAASGAALAIGNQHFFANLTGWSPVHMATSAGLASPLPSAGYARIAWTPMLGEWDLGVGAQSWFGTASIDDGTASGTVADITTKAWALDAQAQGRIADRPVNLFASIATAAGSGSVPNVFHDGPRDRSAVAIAGQFGILPELGSLLLAYRHGDNGTAANHVDRSATIGAMYMLSQNVQFQLNYSMRSGNAYTPRPADGNSLLTIMLAAGF